MTDRELMQRAHKGNKEAVEIIIIKYYDDIFRFCLYMIRNEDDSYDITQETFLKFMKYGLSCRHKNLKGYLLTIARNLCFNYFREQKLQVYEKESMEGIPENQDKIGDIETFLYLQKLLGELSQENREVVILRIYEELKYKDIAKIMGCSVSTAKSRFRLGIQHLKKRMEEENGKS